ncbi:MAG: type I restriction enzyme HsdR N-terminal domain-containing protein [Thermodesulfobacteriota bacterium]
MGRHHLVLGELTDYVTGRTMVDTHDERARQAIARMLVDEKGYDRADLTVGTTLPLTVNGQSGTVRVDFVVGLNGRAVMAVIYGPGAIVSRQRPALAAARLLEPYVIPRTVISNGREAHVMDTRTGKVIAEGLDAIPSKQDLLTKMDLLTFDTLSPDRIDKERRILFCMEVLSEKECDEYVCRC